MSVSTCVRSTLLGLLVLVPGVATAQDNEPVPRVSIGAGAGMAIPFHGDFDFTPWAWDADLRTTISRHVVFEGAVGEWRHVATSVRENIPVTTPLGVIGRLEQTTTRVLRTIQANVLFSTAGPVRVTAGGGVGLLQHRRRTQQVAEDCSSGVSCNSFESTFSSVSGVAQAVGGVEGRLSGGLGLYGQVRFVVPMNDPGGSDLRLTTGLRWRFGS